MTASTKRLKIQLERKLIFFVISFVDIDGALEVKLNDKMIIDYVTRIEE